MWQTLTVSKSLILVTCVWPVSFWDVRTSVFQYLGDTLSEKVKTKVIAMLYSWTVSLPDEAKISEAYQMLRSQGENDRNSLLSKDKITVWQYHPKPTENPLLPFLF